jgi:hypothetical protein
MKMQNELKTAQENLELKLTSIVSGMFDPIAESFSKISEATLSKRQEISGENFDGWLPLTYGVTAFYDFTLQELKNIRDVSRNLSLSNEIYKNCLYHYRNNIIGSGLSIDIYSEDLDEDPAKLATAKDSTVATMKENWKLFCMRNNMHTRTVDWLNRYKRDGEAFVRLFRTGDVPTIRFVDPVLITSDKTDSPYGIQFDKNDAETVKKYYVLNQATNTYKAVPPEDMIHTKDVVDIDAPRGFMQGYSIFTNLRRVEKLLVNISVLAQIQSAIALIRKHKGAKAAKVQSFLDKTSTGSRTNTAGSTVRTRQFDPGTIIDSPDGTEYDFPAHNIKVDGLVSVADKDLGMIAANFVLPVEWLLSKEAPEPLPPSSPVIANFRSEQAKFYEAYIELFWRVQEAMGVDRETNEIKYNVRVTGPRLAIAKAIDEARSDEIYMRLGSTSPQEVAAKNGNNWTVSRANMIRHRNTAQPGEQMPGDAGNTNTGGGDGTSKAGGGQKTDSGTGGNNGV